MMLLRYLLAVVFILDLGLKASGEDDGCRPEGSTEFCAEGNFPTGTTDPGELDVPTDEATVAGLRERPRQLGPFGSHRAPDGDVVSLPFMISPEDFHQHFVTKHRPVLFKGGAQQWPAYTLWEDEYLIKHLGEGKGQQEGNFDLADPDMRKDIIIPTCLRCEEIYSKYAKTHLYLSKGQTSSKLHIHADENLFCVLRGSLTVLLVSPLHSNDVYADEATLLGVSPVDVDAVDMEKYPRVADVHYLKADLEAGDLLYVPQLWWQQVRTAPGRQQAVVISWKSKPVQKQTDLQPQELKTAGNPERRYSFGQWLAAHELWVQNVSNSSPRLTCNQQNSPMSLYTFETKEDKDLFNGPQLDEERCTFDDQNPKCPCSYEGCQEDDQTPECVRYIMDYCMHWEDRGCVMELPQLLNKLYRNDFDAIAQLKSDYIP